MAQMTITTTSAQDSRLAPAFGDKLQLGRNATIADVKAWTIDQWRAVVFDYERKLANQSIPDPSAFDPS
jgi:hypothetical protein